MYIPIVSTLTALTGLSGLKAIPAQTPATSQPAGLVHLASRNTPQQPLADLPLPTITSAKPLASGHRMYARREGGYNTPVRNGDYHYTVVVDDETLGVTPSESPAPRVLETREENGKEIPSPDEMQRFMRMYTFMPSIMAESSSIRSVEAWEFPNAPAPTWFPTPIDGGWQSAPDIASATAMPTTSLGGWENFPSRASVTASVTQNSLIWDETLSKATTAAVSYPNNNFFAQNPEDIWKPSEEINQHLEKVVWVGPSGGMWPQDPDFNKSHDNHPHETVSHPIPTLTGIWANVTAKTTTTATAIATDHGPETAISSTTSTASPIVNTTIAPWRLHDWKPPVITKSATLQEITKTLNYTIGPSVYTLESITHLAQVDEVAATDVAAAATPTL
ncbi:hypothetical protein E4T39_07211 [Aureobasidium subglaciale]|nr:hypothetical protein E4T39_07211 [Aureobasidium subglaciale]